MKNILLIQSVIILSVISVLSVYASVKSSYDDCINALSRRNYDDLMRHGDMLLEEGADKGDEEAQTLGLAFILRGRLSSHKDENNGNVSIQLEDMCERLQQKGDTNSNAYYFAKSALALYHLYEELDFTEAATEAYAALRCAERLKNPDFEADALNTLTAVYFLKQDSAGWEFALRSERISKSHSNYSGMYTASINLANYLFNSNEYDKALTHLKNASEWINKGQLDAEKTYVEAFLGDIYSHLDNDKEAESHYRKAIAADSVTTEYDRGYARMCYADFLESRGRLAEAVMQLRIAEEKIDTIHKPNYYVHLMLQLARIYEKSNRQQESIDYYKRYIDEQTILLTAEKERALATAETRYKVVDAQNRNMRQSLEIAGKNRRLTFAWWIISILVVIGLLLGVMYRRSRIYYKRAVASTLENLEKQKYLQQQLAEALDSGKNNSHKATEGEKGNDIFIKLKELMEVEHVYRDTELTMESLAKKVGTNRTYLSRIINERTGMSYASFVNEYRLNEIILALSDPDNCEDLKTIRAKAGFATQANFYNLFKQKVGVSPAIFRRNAIDRENVKRQSSEPNYYDVEEEE